MGEVWEGAEEELIPAAFDATIIGRLLGYALPYRWRLAGCLALTALATVLDLALPWLTKVAVDRYLAPAAGAGLAPEAAEAGLSSLVVVVLVIIVLQALVAFAETWLVTDVGQRAVLDLRMALYEHVQGLAPSFFDRNPVGRLVTRVANDVNVILELFTNVMVTFVKDLGLLGGVVVAMLVLEWRLALVAFAVLPPLFLATVVFSRLVRDAWRDIRVLLARLNAFLAEHLAGVRVVQLFGRERATVAEFDAANEGHYGAAMRQLRVYAVFMPMVSLLSSVGLALLYWWGGLGVLKGAVTFGTLVAFAQYMEKFFRPIRDLSEKYTMVQSAVAAGERLFALLDLDERVAVPSPTLVTAADEPFRGLIEFRDVWFEYVPGRPVLRGLSFRVEPGCSLALVGHTGAGKTSVVNLLLRQYEWQRGQILLDGRDLRSWEPRLLRRNLACVRQDVFTFAGSVEENVRLWTPGLGREDVERALRHVGADGFVGALAGGLDAEVGERGALLSVGQRQLLSFARALVHGPRVLLLDEATSSVDSMTEAAVQTALETLLDEYTSVVVAHRLSTIRHATSILVLHRGELREQGSHDELMRRRDVYWRLVQLAGGGGDGACADAALSPAPASP